MAGTEMEGCVIQESMVSMTDLFPSEVRLQDDGAKSKRE